MLGWHAGWTCHSMLKLHRSRFNWKQLFLFFRVTKYTALPLALFVLVLFVFKQYGYFYHLIMIFCEQINIYEHNIFLIYKMNFDNFSDFCSYILWRFSLKINVSFSYINFLFFFYKGVTLFRKSFRINIYLIKTLIYFSFVLTNQNMFII